jgi:hypothetical protein
MRQQFRMSRLRLELTEEQKEQIWQATGRRVTALELGLEGEREPDEPPMLQRPDPPVPDTVPPTLPASRGACRTNEGSTV